MSLSHDRFASHDARAEFIAHFSCLATSQLSLHTARRGRRTPGQRSRGSGAGTGAKPLVALPHVVLAESFAGRPVYDHSFIPRHSISRDTALTCLYRLGGSRTGSVASGHGYTYDESDPAEGLLAPAAAPVSAPAAAEG